MLVNKEQIAKIRNRFNVDGIPYYILVDREGKATGHPLPTSAGWEPSTPHSFQFAWQALPYDENASSFGLETALKALEEIKTRLTPVPETDGDLFDAIVAPYKGKVVLVDLWNTWCGPCRAALRALV